MRGTAKNGVAKLTRKCDIFHCFNADKEVFFFVFSMRQPILDVGHQFHAQTKMSVGGFPALIFLLYLLQILLLQAEQTPPRACGGRL